MADKFRAGPPFPIPFATGPVLPSSTQSHVPAQEKYLVLSDSTTIVHLHHSWASISPANLTISEAFCPETPYRAQFTLAQICEFSLGA